MSRDLEQLLRDAAVEPSAPVDPKALRVRGRRRRRVRRATAAAGSVVAATVAVAVVLSGPATAPQRPEVVDRPDQLESDEDPERDPDGERVAPREDRGDAAEDGDGEDGRLETVELEEAGWPLLVSSDRGITRVEDGERHELWEEGVTVALSDLAGGVVLQEAEEGPIRWLPEDADAPAPPLAAEDRPVLHAVVDRDGPTVLFTRRVGEGEAEEETLYAHRLQDDTEEPLGVTGRLESGLSGAAVVDDDLLISTCHLECRLTLVPWGDDPDGDRAVELHDGLPLPLHGLDAEDGVAAYAYVPPQHVELEDEDDDPSLWRQDLMRGDVARDDHDEIALPSPQRIEEPWSAEVELNGDATAALVRFQSVQQPDDGETLLVERLDERPRLRWLATSERVQFDTPALANDTS